MYPAAENISSDLLGYLRDLYATAFYAIISKSGNENTSNSYTKHAIPGYIIAVATIESFMNEFFLSPAGRSFFKNAPKNDAYWEDLERLSLLDKLITVPEIFLRQTFDTGKQPYQDMKQLISVRNELTHYKMGFEEPKFIKNLQHRKIALSEPGHTWTRNISTLKGIFWAHNTVCSTIQTMCHFATPETHPLLAGITGHSFYAPWTEAFIRLKARELLSKQK
jgi:hypothetical protein